MSDNKMKLDEYWPYQAVVLGDLVSRHTTSVLKRHGELNLSQWRVLAAVAEKEGRTAAEVVAVTPMDKGIVSRATAALVKSGHIKKREDASDKRRTHLYITPTGSDSYYKILSDLRNETQNITNSTQLNDDLLRIIGEMQQIVDCSRS